MPFVVPALAAVGTAVGASAGTAVATGAAVTSLGVGLAGAAISMDQQREAAKQAEAARRVQTRRQNVQALREAQIKRAMLAQQSASTGTLGSSGFEGGTSSLQSQLGSNLGFANQMTEFNRNISRYQQRADNTQAITGVVQQGIGLAGTMGAPSGTVPQSQAQGLTTQGGINAAGTNQLYGTLYG